MIITCIKMMKKVSFFDRVALKLSWYFNKVGIFNKANFLLVFTHWSGIQHRQ